MLNRYSFEERPYSLTVHEKDATCHSLSIDDAGRRVSTLGPECDRFAMEPDVSISDS